MVKNEWILDSWYSFDMSHNFVWFTDINAYEFGIVYIGNNNSCKIQGTSSITFELHDGMNKLLTNVRYVLGLKRNLISLGTLDELGYWYKTKSGSLHVYND